MGVVGVGRRIKEGRYLIAHAHEGTMGKRFPSAHWLVMGLGGSESAAPWVNAARRIKEGRYLIALPMGGQWESGSPPLIG